MTKWFLSVRNPDVLAPLKWLLLWRWYFVLVFMFYIYMCFDRYPNKIYNNFWWICSRRPIRIHIISIYYKHIIYSILILLNTAVNTLTYYILCRKTFLINIYVLEFSINFTPSTMFLDRIKIGSYFERYSYFC